jgi:proline iminopeptidase
MESIDAWLQAVETMSITQEHPAGSVRVIRSVLSVLASVLAIVLGIALGVLAGVLALAVSLPVGLGVGGVAVFISTWWLTAQAHRIWPSAKPRTRSLAARRSPYIIAAAMTAIVAVIGGATILTPVTGSNNPTAEPDPAYWDLSTGSRVAYWHYDSTTDNDTPIVFVHGGPGAYATQTDRDVLPRLTQTGHDVYIYDQPGAGFSPDLALDDYNEKRVVADLEGIRETIGSDKMILLGESAGGYITQAYAVAHPEHVEKIMLSAPESYATPTAAQKKEDAENAKIIAELNPGHSDSDSVGAALQKLQTNNRFMAAAIMTSGGLWASAENLLSQEDSRRLTAQALGLDAGINIYTNLKLAGDFTKNSDETLAAMRDLKIPTLMVKPEYDFIDWSGQHPFIEANPDIQVVYLKGAEHNAWGLQPDASIEIMSTFIRGESQEVYTGTIDPRIAEANGQK